MESRKMAGRKIVNTGQIRRPAFQIAPLVRASPSSYYSRVKTNITALLQPPAPSSSFRLYLQAELARRCATNPQYPINNQTKE
jgi:hypothetical protein